MPHFDFSVVLQFRDALLKGLLISLELSAICAFLGIILGFIVGVARQSRFVAIRTMSTVYVEVLRGSPVLITVFWIFFCLPLIVHVRFDAFTSSVLALTLYMAAVASESFRSSLKSVGRDQYDACSALGLTPVVRAIYVIAPQAVIRAIPTLLSNTVSLFKESSIVSAVGMVELMYTAQNISNITARPVEVLTTAALLYFVVGFVLTRIVNRLENRILSRIGA
jgi:polar amino acid transport system permease protein